MIPRLAPPVATDDLVTDFAARLRLHGFSGEIDDSHGQRTALATDNSIYQVRPRLAVFPRSVDDVTRVARMLAMPMFQSIKAYPRGGGTGTNGQSLGDGVVVDLSRHMNRILEINIEERWARVEAGVVKDQLEAAVRAHGLFFAPELSTSNRATIGGMVSTDASGQGSCVYGKTRDHVLSLRTVLLDGQLWTSEAITQDRLAEITGRDDRAGQAHRVVDAIQRADAELIAQQFPPLNRCLTGYDLAHIRDAGGEFNLNSILCGSEGTLGFLVEAKLRLLPVPRHAALIVASYASFDAALRDAPRLLACQAASIETMDHQVIALARQDNAWPAIAAFFPPGTTAFEGVNVVEFLADDAATLQAAMARAQALFDTPGPQAVLFHAAVTAPRDRAAVWAMRKRAVGLLGRLDDTRRPIPFVEDTAVPPEHLADYIAEFRALLDRHGVRYGMFGHADAGVLHVRPAIDLKDPAQEGLVRSITDGVVALTRRYGGVLWGEHGKGMRSEFAPQYFGPLYARLQQIKAVFDPHNQLNPGKIAAPADAALLRIDGVPTRGQHDRVIPIAVRQAFDDALHCNGNGACFNFDPDDAMCPSWKGTRDRRFSPKGRAGLLREWLRLMTLAGAGAQLARPPAEPAWRRLAALPRRMRNSLAARRGEYDFSHEVKEAMDTCLACKSCAGQCPVKVDVPGLRAKFLSHYHARYLRPLSDHLVCLLEPLLPWAARVPRLANGVLHSRAGRAGLRALGLVGIPRLDPVDAVALLRREGFAPASAAAVQAARAAGRTPVILVPDAFTTHFDAAVVADSFRLLARLGFAPLWAPVGANGKALHVHGRLGAFHAVARRQAARLQRLAAMGAELVGIDPAMTLVYGAEYREVLDQAALPRVWLLQEWLAHALPAPASPATPQQSFVLLPHCTEKTNAPQAVQDWRQVFARLGFGLEVLPAGCCGMSGTYGHMADQRATADAIYRASWAPLVERHGASGRLMATGYSCRSQVKLMHAAATARHPVQVLLQALAAA